MHNLITILGNNLQNLLNVFKKQLTVRFHAFQSSMAMFTTFGKTKSGSEKQNTVVLYLHDENRTLHFVTIFELIVKDDQKEQQINLQKLFGFVSKPF